jgi:hypothetical protein
MFNLGNKAKPQGAKSGEKGGWGTATNVAVSYKLCGFQGCVGGRVVVMEQSGTCSDFLANSISATSWIVRHQSS